MSIAEGPAEGVEGRRRRKMKGEGGGVPESAVRVGEGAAAAVIPGGFDLEGGKAAVGGTAAISIGGGSASASDGMDVMPKAGATSGEDGPEMGG